MVWEKAEKIVDEYLAAKNRKHSEQRREILRIFSKLGKHVTANELYRIVQKENSSIGCATIYRTLKLLCECGLCHELKLEDGTARYEYYYQGHHHDHLICIRCGQIVEVVDPQIERLQEKLAKQHGFVSERHHMELYGVCKKCKK